MRKLAFTPDGATLLHSTQSKNVAVWAIPDYRLRYTCPGSLIGVSRNGQTFLTKSKDACDAWETATGKRCALDELNPKDYDLHQRTVTSADELKMILQVQDLLVPALSTTIYVNYPKDCHPRLDAWAVAPNNQDIVVTYCGDVGGHDWAHGQCIDIARSKKRFELEVDRFQGEPVINFSAEHNLLVMSSDDGSCKVYDLLRGIAIRQVWVEEAHFAHVAAVSPQNQWLLALSTWETSKESRSMLFSIQLQNTAKLIRDGAIVQHGKVERVIRETGWIESLLFSDSNGFCGLGC
jgi:WD40 repeat protein